MPRMPLSLALMGLLACKDPDDIIARWKEDAPATPPPPPPPSAFAVAVKESCDIAQKAVDSAFTPGLAQTWHPNRGQCAARASGPRFRPDIDVVALVSAPFADWTPLPDRSTDAPKGHRRAYQQGERVCEAQFAYDQDTAAASTYFEVTLTCTVPVPADAPATPAAPTAP